MSIVEEFSDLTNKEAYEHAFINRFMLRSRHDSQDFIGNTQRADFMPHLKQQLKLLPAEAQIFDVGAGAGEVIDFALHALSSATINLEEPNEILLNQYLQRIKQYTHLHEGKVFAVKIQELYQSSSVSLSKESQDLILSIHMLYHLTDFTAPSIDPREDLIAALSYIYSLLKPGGKMFLVYADNEISTLGKAAIAYYQLNNSAYAKALQKIYRSRNQLLLEGDIIPVLLSYDSKHQPILDTFRQASYMYAHSLEDLGAMCLVAELIPSDNKKFDIEKLKFCIEFIQHNSHEIGLCVERREILQKGMLRCNQPQVVCILQKGE